MRPGRPSCWDAFTQGITITNNLRSKPGRFLMVSGEVWRSERHVTEETEWAPRHLVDHGAPVDQVKLSTLTSTLVPEKYVEFLSLSILVLTLW